MIKIKNQLSRKEEKEIYSLIQCIDDVYGDFYLTRNKLRLYIRENFSILLKSLERGDKIIYCDEGILLVTGFAEKEIKIFNIKSQKEEIRSTRHYIKFLTKNNKVADKLIQVLLWNLGHLDLYCKLNNKNPIKQILLNKGFSFRGGRGKEILLCRKGKLKRIPKIVNKE